MVGGGGHASVLVDILLNQGRNIVAIVCPEALSQRAVFNGIRHLNRDEDVLEFDPNEVLLINGIGPSPRGQLRAVLKEKFSNLGYFFEGVVSKYAIISEYAELARDVQVLNGAIVQAGAVIGESSVINTGAIIEHDCLVGKHNHVAPGAILCGQVQTANNVYIGASATIIQSINLEQGCVISAGATVVRDVPMEQAVYGFRSVIKQKEAQ